MNIQLYDNKNFNSSIDYGVDWYQITFTEDGESNFYIKPNNDLCVALYVYESVDHILLAGSTYPGLGRHQLICSIDVKKGKTYYIQVVCIDGTGNYSIRCKNYPYKNSRDSTSQNNELKKTCTYTKIATSTNTLDSVIENYIATHNLFCSKQKQVLRKIPQYLNKKAYQSNISVENIFTQNKPLLFFFEGAGGYTYKSSNPHHPHGRFGAIAIVIRDKKIQGIFTDASTLPDKPFSAFPHATIDAGIYLFNSGTHHSSCGYPALHVNGNANIPAMYSSQAPLTHKTASGIHIHMGYNHDNPLNPTSTGCLTIHKNSYMDFCHKVGFVSTSITALPHNISTTSVIAGTVSGVYYMTGIVVVDRSLFDESTIC